MTRRGSAPNGGQAGGDAARPAARRGLAEAAGARRPADRGGLGEAGGARRSVDRDGVVTIEQPGGGSRKLWPLGLALPALLGLAFLVLTSFPGRKAPPAPSPAAPPSAPAADEARPAAPRPRAALAQAEPAAPDVEPDEAEVEPPPEPTARRRDGIYAFPPPGTKRIKEGLVVPDGFPLPPGYMRHYQTTDKGEMLQAILVFHPDFQPVDASGNPVTVPENRVVPPELAPPGLALETLVVPADAYADPERERAEAGL
ncbi:MAG TPA: hypothetical protein VFS00_10895 [Polyangiaceae bacterium]|nr:hypothetical protein [Polyangiaceae bacterium]